MFGHRFRCLYTRWQMLCDFRSYTFWYISWWLNAWLDNWTLVRIILFMKMSSLLFPLLSLLSYWENAIAYSPEHHQIFILFYKKGVSISPPNFNSWCGLHVLYPTHFQVSFNQPKGNFLDSFCKFIQNLSLWVVLYECMFFICYTLVFRVFSAL